MKKFFLATVGLVALGMTAPAWAADLPARPYTKAPPPVVAAIYDWSGFYIGLNGGGGWSHKCWDLNTAAGVFQANLGCHDATGGLVGGQIGYRWQASSWVFGLEAQGDWADLKGSNASLFTAGVTNQTRIDALGLFTGQIGYAWNNVLWYLKGGAAVARDRYDGIGAVVGVFDKASETRWGGVVGAGLEFGFAPNWSAGVEYDHAFMGNHNLNFVATGALAPVGTFSRNVTVRQDIDMVTARINYHFGGPAIARY
jgi:outer membrane immunogenic protein